jgi:hypothetical protein
VKFHDGSELTSADVKGSWDKIVFPPEGVTSPRRSSYQMVKSIETSDRHTVVFRLHHPSPSFLSSLAHPANFIYAKKHLDTNVNYYKAHTIGTGPFKLKHYVRGSYIELERNPDYWKKGLPYLDGIKYFIITDTLARAKALRSGRVDIELRHLPPAEVDGITAQMGDKTVVAKVQNISNWGVAINVEKKPFDDERVTRDFGLVLYFEWSPPLVFVPFWEDPGENFAQLVWPIVTIGYRNAAIGIRMTRSAVLEVMREDYIRTAWAKGLHERIVVSKHTLKNAMLPVITIIGAELAFLLGGLVVTETVLTLNGLGRFMVDAIWHRDIPVVQTMMC